MTGFELLMLLMLAPVSLTCVRIWWERREPLFVTMFLLLAIFQLVIAFNMFMQGASS